MGYDSMNDNNRGGRTTSIDELSLCSQNLCRSNDAQQDWLITLGRQKHTIGLAQEPYIDARGNSRANHTWNSIYPTTHRKRPQDTRAFMVVSTSISPDAWTQVEVESPDVTAIKISDRHGDLFIFNVYLDQSHSDALFELGRKTKDAQREGTRKRRPTHFVWAGDFNRHSPLWDEERNHHLFTRRNITMAQTLIDMVAKYDLKMALPHGTPTLEAMTTGNHTRPDNVFISDSIMDRLVSCTTTPERRPPKTDHFPIMCRLRLSLEYKEPVRRLNWSKTDWSEYRDTLREKLESTPHPEDIRTREEFDDLLGTLNRAIQDTTDKHVDRQKLTPYTKRWWTKDLNELRKMAHHLGKKSYGKRSDREHPIHEEFRRARNRYTNSIKLAKEQCWMKWLDAVRDDNMWKTSAYISSPSTDASRARVPDLITKDAHGDEIKATTNEETTALFKREFFPSPPDRIQIDGDDHEEEYPRPAFEFAPITDERIRNTIAKLQPHKAPDTDEFSNAILINCADALITRLGPLFRAVHALKYWPEDWKFIAIIVLRKPGKGDYTKPGSHRPISLIKKIAMLFSKCLSDELLYQTEKHHLLAPTQFGFRPGRATTDAIHYGIAKVKDAWRKGKCCALLLLDIKAAFPHIVVSVLVHKMRMKGVPREYTDWIQWRFKGRKTRLAFDDYQSDEITIEDGLDQGDPFSTTGMIFYIDDLLRNSPDREDGEEAIGFADDVGLLTIGDDLEEAAGKAESFMVREGGAMDWSAQTNCIFGLDKTQCLGLTRKREPDEQRTSTLR